VERTACYVLRSGYEEYPGYPYDKKKIWTADFGYVESPRLQMMAKEFWNYATRHPPNGLRSLFIWKPCFKERQAPFFSEKKKWKRKVTDCHEMGELAQNGSVPIY